MYVLDTNVISELAKPKKRIHPNVGRWAAMIDPELLYLSAITLWEIELGVLRIERRDPRQGVLFRTWIDESVGRAFAGRILPFDEEAALRCAPLHVPNPRPDRDSLIAATALVRNMIVVTRNVRDFEPMGVPYVNPWEPQPA